MNRSQQLLRRLVVVLICIQLLLVVSYATDAWIQGESGEVRPLIDLDAEGNLPTWFSSFQLSLVALAFWAMAAHTRATSRPSRRFLRLCGGFFLLLSADETAMFHERITASNGSRYVDWLPNYLAGHKCDSAIIMLVVLAALAAAYPHLKGLWRISPRNSLIAVTGCGVYVSGAAILETIGYKMIEAGVAKSLYRLEVAAEEFLEMLGVSLILYAVLSFYSLSKSAGSRGVRARHSLHPVFTAAGPPSI